MTRQNNNRAERQVKSNDSSEIPDRRDIRNPRPPFGAMEGEEGYILNVLRLVNREGSYQGKKKEKKK